MDLFFLSANSGEVDKESTGQAVAVIASGDGAVQSRGFRRLIKSRAGEQNTRVLLEELFADLRRRSGALVIASTTGTELAYESAALQNGVFTHALINGLRMASTDLNSDGVISVSELREMVATNVAQLTAGRQRPVARREGIDFDLAVARPTSSAAPGSL